MRLISCWQTSQILDRNGLGFKVRGIQGLQVEAEAVDWVIGYKPLFKVGLAPARCKTTLSGHSEK